MAQPITGMRGDVYHEILLRMKGENDELISPDSFLRSRTNLVYRQYRHVGH